MEYEQGLCISRDQAGKTTIMEVCCTRLLRVPLQGGTVSQANPVFRDGLSLAAFMNVSVLSTIFAKAILSSESLPMIINLNSTRLAKAYRRLPMFFDRYGIYYLPCDAGHFVQAKLVRNTGTKEPAIMDQLIQSEDLVSPGYVYHIAERG